MAIPAVGCFHGASVIAVIPHLNTWGSYRNHNSGDSSKNSAIAWIFSLGEGWHNNHHNNPRNYRSGEKWWELDHSAFIIKHFLMIPDKK
jgi:stearoyl-CoA desaturase (delta-9 desaturase)